MISITGLISFLLRLTLMIQGQVGEALPSVFSEGKNCISLESNECQVHAIVDFEHQNSCALCEAEEEEKSESETESLADFPDAWKAMGFLVINKEYYNPFFGNKGLRGDQHLYDLFHSWKTDMS